MKLPPWDDTSSPLRTTEEVARYLRMYRPDGQPDRKEAIRYLTKQGVQARHRGRAVLYLRDDVESTLHIRRTA